MAGSAAGSAGFSTAPSPDALRFGSSVEAGASTTFVGEALPSTEVLAFFAATTGSVAAGAALVFSARAGDDMVSLRRRASTAWWSGDGVAPRHRFAHWRVQVRRREEDLLPARETGSKNSAAIRCGCGGVCVWRAHCGVAADGAQLKFSQR